jgi:hypothetical protein
VAVAGVLLSRTVSGDLEQLPFPTGACRHDNSALAQDRARQQGAVALARAINAAEGVALGQTRQFAPLRQLRSLPATPEGFVVRFYGDVDGYIFSVKDERDPCHYGIFSDQYGRLYEMTPDVPRIAS